MPEHLIRLRGGWEWREPEAASAARRVTLPMTWPAGLTSRVRLIRSFQRPPIDPAHEALALRLESVSGLVAAWLNGRELARPNAGATALCLPLDDPLPPRNVLVLEVDPQVPSHAGTDAEPWGTIALVIRPASS
jgi:hypothetical protein